MTKKEAIELGFKELPNLTFINAFTYDLEREKILSLTDVGTANESLSIGQLVYNPYHKYVDNSIILHLGCLNGKLSAIKVKKLIEALQELFISEKIKSSMTLDEMLFSHKLDPSKHKGFTIGKGRKIYWYITTVEHLGKYRVFPVDKNGQLGYSRYLTGDSLVNIIFKE